MMVQPSWAFDSQTNHILIVSLYQGRHPNAYHEYVLDRINEYDAIARGNKEIFIELFEGLKKEVRENPDMLYKEYWLKKK